MLYRLEEWQKMNRWVDAINRSYEGSIEDMIITREFIRFVVYDRFKKMYEVVHWEIKKHKQFHIAMEKDLSVAKYKMSQVFKYPLRVDTKLKVK